ncbi:polysaccharide biosynthesis protein [Bacteroides intestinalis]|jgi:putative LPS biosynthesis related dehydratase|uniref:polysaccharide biosynthesis protein n=1 Tax=Bacteroides intestinalis TaxID=329854 RepID=UPI0018A07F75|nr:polysaccharide biosynthesis protein [Bacteroides intestinalis]
MSIFKGKTLLITGGTGSFGNMVLKRFLDSDIKEIRIFSRDEKKQDDMRHILQAQYSESVHKVKFYIGDVRNRQSIDVAMRGGVDYIFSAAALKQVPSCEFFPMQAVETNVYGTNNVLESAIAHGVSNVVVLSTDKAAYPINAMGISKAMMEKVAIAKARQLGENAKTTICCTRYGNVMASRGSVIPLWVDQIEAGKLITITDPNMSRFMMTLNDAVDLVIYAFEHGNNGDLFVQKAPAATLDVLAEALKQTYARVKPEYGETEVKVIGTRHGEKLYETLVTREEMARAIDMGGYYRIPCDARDLNYDKIEGGNPDVDKMDEYHSHNTRRLTIEQMKELLLKLTFIREDLGLQPRAHTKEIRSE